MGSFPKAAQAVQYNTARQHGGSIVMVHINLPLTEAGSDAHYAAARLVRDALKAIEPQLMLIDDEIKVVSNIVAISE